jgi:prepilin-type N-terminal cleavage/methylation domain-containing protein/prepilin-type processing-associated H-X9-DG protein
MAARSVAEQRAPRPMSRIIGPSLPLPGKESRMSFVPRSRRTGFTLIELLVVIAIIAILAAILFPVFAQARGKARQAACLSNTKQIGLALMQYSQDYDETYPGYRFAIPHPFAADANVGASAKTQHFLINLLFPYTKSYEVWACPSNPQSWVNIDRDGVMGNAGSGFQSYGGQNSYGASQYLFKSNEGRPESEIVEPANTVGVVDAFYYNVLPKGPANGPCGLIGETNKNLNNTIRTNNNYQNYWKNLGNSYWGFSDIPNPSDADANKRAKERHSEFLNVIWMDGHAKATRFEVLKNDPGLVVGGTTSIWDPFKKGCEPAFVP